MKFFRRFKFNCDIRYYSSLFYHLLKEYWLYWLVSLILLTLSVYVFGVLLTGLWILLLLLYYISNLSDQLLYNPNVPNDSRTNVINPKTAFKLDYENIFIFTEDNVKINMQFISLKAIEDRRKATTIVFFHGNAGNIGHRLVNAIEMHRRLECNVLLVEYRGYGLSTGQPSEKGLLRDGMAAVKYLRNRPDINSSQIVLFGRSLGGAVAIGVASIVASFDDDFNLAAIIIENTFTSVPEIAKHFLSDHNYDQLNLVRLFRLMPDFLLNFFYKSRFESFKKITQITVPTLFISGQADELIPIRMMNKLFKNSSASHKELHAFESGDHNFTWKCYGYYETFKEFLSKILKNRKKYSIGSLPKSYDDASTDLFNDSSFSSKTIETLPLIPNYASSTKRNSDTSLLARSPLPTPVIESFVIFHPHKSSSFRQKLINSQHANFDNPNYLNSKSTEPFFVSKPTTSSLLAPSPSPPPLQPPSSSSSSSNLDFLPLIKSESHIESENQSNIVLNI